MGSSEAVAAPSRVAGVLVGMGMGEVVALEVMGDTGGETGLGRSSASVVDLGGVVGGEMQAGEESMPVAFWKAA